MLLTLSHLISSPVGIRETIYHLFHYASLHSAEDKWTIFVYMFVCFQDEGKAEGGNDEKRFDPSGYDKDLVEGLERDILQRNPNVHW